MKSRSVFLTASIATILATTAASAEEYILTADLRGSNEIPGPGDADGSGSADITLDTEKLRLCYAVSVANITTPTAAHIHAGAAGVSGAPVVTLDTPKKGTAKNCLDLTKEVATAIATNPGSYYVNVHSEEFPAGAVRGQLVAD